MININDDKERFRAEQEFALQKELVKTQFDNDDCYYEDCDDCGGTGYVGHDCGEDTCCCLNPEDNILCDTCGGRGSLEKTD